MNPVRLLAALAAIIVGLIVVLIAVDTGADEETVAIGGGDGTESGADPSASSVSADESDTADPDDPDSAGGDDVDLPVTAPVGADEGDPFDEAAEDDTSGDRGDAPGTADPVAPTTTTVAVTTTAAVVPSTTTLPSLVLLPTDTFPCSFASRQAMLNRLSDIEELDEFSDADLYLRTVARSILEVGQVLTEDERVTDLEAAFEAFRSFPDGCPEVIDDAFDTGDRFLCRASQISVDERIHDYLVRAVGDVLDGCTYPEIDQ